MSIANFDSEREARSFLNKHIREMHGGKNPIELGHTLNASQMDKFHQMVHMDDFALPPHSHADDDVREIDVGPYDDQYLRNIIDTVKEVEEE